MNNRWLYIVLIFVLCAWSTDKGYAQNIEDTKITIDVEKITMSEFLNRLSDLTKLSISFSGSTTDKYTLTLSVKDQTLKETLIQAFKNTTLTYKIVGRGVMVFDSEKKNESLAGEPITISGTVTDKSGASLPGVNVIVKGTATGVSTDANGKYSITAEDDDILVFSFIGLKTFETPLNARTVIDVVMDEDVSTLNEVVINGGYYKTSEKLKTGNIAKVTAKEIENQPVTSPLMALQGRVAGLDVTPSSGTPGAAPVVRIRGNNSLRVGAKGATDRSMDGNYPLYVIDGVPVSSVPLVNYSTGFNEGGYDPLSAINPSNIQSIEILKDGDATAIYGSRGANGVILITTKRNDKNAEHSNVDFKVTSGLGWIANRMDLLNTPQYVTMRNEMRKNENLPLNAYYFPDLVLWDTTRYTNWQDQLIGGTANINDVQGGISGGNKNTSFRFGLGYHKETLVTPGDFGFKRATGNLSVNHTSANQKLRASFSANYGFTESDMFQGDFMSAALSLPPNAPELYDETGDLNWEIHDGVSTWNNPMAYLRSTTNSSKRDLITGGNISYEVLPGVTLSTSIGLSDLVSTTLNKGPISANPVLPGIQRFGSSVFIDEKRNSWIVEPKISLAKQWGEHQLDFLIGSTWQGKTGWYNLNRGVDYPSDALLGSLKGAGRVDALANDFTKYKYTSLYSRAGYNYAQKYLLNLTVRRDGSSRFGPGNRFGNFWSVGGAWIFSSENGMKDLSPVLSFGKLRASYGLTGSDNVGDYEYYNLYDLQDWSYQGLRGLTPAALDNPDYAWEETRKLEAAVELAFLEGRISTEVSWYRNRSSNQLVQYTLPATAGFDYVLQNFDATIQNTGLEILVRSDVVSGTNWNWNISFNITFLENKLLEFKGIEDSPYANQYKVGEPLSIQFLYTYKGINQETGLYEVEDKNNDGKFNDFDKSLTRPMEKSPYGGLINTIQYKNLEVSFNLYFAKRDVPRFYWGNQPGSRYNFPVVVLDRWQRPGDITSIQRYGVDEVLQTYSRMTTSDFNITDGSFIRLRTLSIGYNLPMMWLERVKLQSAKLFIEGQNLFTVAKYTSGLDPETGVAMPPLQMITLGLQLRL